MFTDQSRRLANFESQSWNLKRYSLLGIALIGLAVFLASNSISNSNTVTTEIAGKPGTDELLPGKPARVAIPKLGISAEIAELGLNSDKTIEVPKRPEQVGWFVHGAIPGEPGSAVMVGHLDWHRGVKGVFYDLARIR